MCLRGCAPCALVYAFNSYPDALNDASSHCRRHACTTMNAAREERNKESKPKYQASNALPLFKLTRYRSPSTKLYL